MSIPQLQMQFLYTLPPRFLPKKHTKIHCLGSFTEDPKEQLKPDRQRPVWLNKRPKARQVEKFEELPIVRIGPGSTSTFFSSDKLNTLGLESDVIAALESLGITRPSHIQTAAARALSSSARHVVIADHAGSGKTMAYLLPLLSLIKREEKEAGEAMRKPNRPQIVVVTPTAELCAQVVRVCRALSKAGARHRSIAVTGGRPLKTHKENLSEGIDVLVGTPGRLQELMDVGALSVEECKAIVFDEADILLGDETSAFTGQSKPLLNLAPEACRLLFVSATIPENVYYDLEAEYPGLVAALGPGLHRNPPNIIEQLVDCSGGDEITEESGKRRKLQALFAVLQEQSAYRAIVFCNKIDSCRDVENFLNRTLPKGASEVLPYHGAIAGHVRDSNLRLFLTPPTYKDKERLNRKVLVCTDRASRGVDTSHVDHVILFDFPRDPSEYVRRVGRTARGAGGRGLVSILVLGRQVALAKAIIDKNQKGQPVHRVPVAIPVSNSKGPHQVKE